jgi:2-methylisocitrate lyase-like PEP mutase family enzyme
MTSATTSGSAAPAVTVDLGVAAERADRFAQLHRLGPAERPLIAANAFDAGSAKILAHLGYHALATTSAGFANTLGRRDGEVSHNEAIAHGAAISAATTLPVSADLEHGYASAPEDVAETVTMAAGSGLAGCSIEDWDPVSGMIYDLGLARARIEAAADAAHRGPVRLVLTARAENHFRHVDDLVDTIARLQAYQAAGADVLYAPAIVERDEIARILDAVDIPVNVLAIPGVPPIAELAELGVARVTVGSGFALVAQAALVTAARELLEHGTYGWWDSAAPAFGVKAAFE